MFDDLGGELPLPTQILLDASELITGYWYLLPGVPFVIFCVAKWIARTDKGKATIDRVKLTIPLFVNFQVFETLARHGQRPRTMITHQTVPRINGAGDGNRMRRLALNARYPLICIPLRGGGNAQPIAVACASPPRQEVRH